MKNSFLLQRPGLGLALLSALIPVAVLVGCGGGNDSGPRANSTATPGPSPTATPILQQLEPLQTQLLLLNGQRIAINVTPVGASKQLTGSIKVFAATQTAKAKSANGPQKAITRTLQNGTFKLVGTFSLPRDFRIVAIFDGEEIFTIVGRFPSETERGFYTITLKDGQTENGFFEKLGPIPTSTPGPASTATPRPTSTKVPTGDYRFSGDLGLTNFSSDATIDRSPLGTFSDFSYGGTFSEYKGSAGRTVQNVNAGAAVPATPTRKSRGIYLSFNSEEGDLSYSGLFFIGQRLSFDATHQLLLVQTTVQNGVSSSQSWSANSGQATVTAIRYRNNGTGDLSDLEFQIPNAHFVPSGPRNGMGVGSFDLNGTFTLSGLKRR